MKKLIIKTAFITFGVTVVLAVSLFGILSFCAPAAMMRLCDFIGLDGVGADYAYEEYRNGGDLGYLVRSVEMEMSAGNYAEAAKRFDELYGDENETPKQREAFSDYCNAQGNSSPAGVPERTFRHYICGLAARAKYHLAQTDDQKLAVCAFAVSETETAVSADSPVFALALEAIRERNGDFCALLRARLMELGEEGRFDPSNEHYCKLIEYLAI